VFLKLEPSAKGDAFDGFLEPFKLSNFGLRNFKPFVAPLRFELPDFFDAVLASTESTAA
jgi:hypothetical protein